MTDAMVTGTYPDDPLPGPQSEKELRGFALAERALAEAWVLVDRVRYDFARVEWADEYDIRGIKSHIKQAAEDLQTLKATLTKEASASSPE